MASREKKKKKEEIDYEKLYNQNIKEMDVGEYTKQAVTNYGVNVSVFRACPMIEDGLTPGQRRRLYTFYTSGAVPGKHRYKAVKLLGNVLGLHPHGDMSVNKSFTNDIKPWETNVTLYDVSGNKGSLTGESAASVRYLDVRLSQYAMKCFFDEFDEDVADMVPSNTRQEMEPVSIPSKYPHYLFSTSTGIAWGNAVSVPPFNVSEVCALTIALIKNPNMKNVYLYPDSPRGYDIVESDDIQTICDTGRGSLKIQARMEFHDNENGRYIEVTGFPEQTDMTSIMKKISAMILNKEINDIETLADKTFLDDVKFWVVLKKEADPEFIMDILYKKTLLRSTVRLGFNFAARTFMRPVGLKDSLLIWIENRVEIKHRILLQKLSRKKERICELDGIIMMLSKENRERTTKIISESQSDQEAIDNLKEAYKKYDITSFQAATILDVKIGRISRGSQDRFKDEQDKLFKEIEELQEIVTSEAKIKKIIIEELEECIKLFGKPRQCRIVSPDVLEPPVYKFNIIVTQKYIKKLSPNSTSVGAVESDDEVVGIFKNVPENAKIFVTDNLGRIYGVKLTSVKSHELTAKGDELRSLVGLKGTAIRAFKMAPADIKQLTDDITMIMFMKSGITKRTILSQYISNRVELQGALLNDGDEVSHAILHDASKTEHVLIYTKNGLGIVLDLNNITTTDRLSKGSQYLKLEDGDEIQGVCDIQDNMEVDLLVITSKGYAKFCSLDEIFKTTKRRANMIRLSGLNDDDTIFRMIPWLGEYKKIQCILQSGTKVDLIPTDVTHTTRISKGKKLIPIKRGDAIIKIKLS